ncbi:MAG: serine hydrolase [Colwellia sp.]|nr:serine hydrolase [Colwellia sp.]
MEKSWNVKSKPALQFLFIALIATTLLVGCNNSESDTTESTETDQAPYVYQTPINLNDGWQVDHVSNQNVDEYLLTDLVNNIQNNIDQFRYVDAVLVSKNGRLLLNEQFKTELDFTDDWANNQDLDLHILNSVSKSFASTLIGIAIDQQIIPDINVLVHDYFQHKQPIANWNESKANITLQNWLTMRHGYEWDEWDSSYFDSNNLNAQMNNSNDPMQFLLDRPMAETPANVFAYSTGVSFALGRLVERASGQSLVNFMETNLFEPLSIDNYTYWALDGMPHMGSALYLSTRDLAKLGQLFLDKGLWNGERIVSQSWIEQATQKRVDNDSWGYGYQWWMTSFTANGIVYETFYADGLGGQHVFVFPALNSVVAFNGSAYEDTEKEQRSYRMILENYILPSLQE